MTIYSDLNLNLARNPFTNDVMIKTDVEAVKFALYNLVSTQKYDKFFNPDYGIQIKNLLFENYDPLMNSFYERKVVEMIETYEPRVVLENVLFEGSPDANAITLTITYFVRGIIDKQSLNIDFTRIR
jgi:phage baseplate assembly protein W